MDTLLCFPAILSTGDNFSDFFFYFSSEWLKSSKRDLKLQLGEQILKADTHWVERQKSYPKVLKYWDT